MRRTKLGIVFLSTEAPREEIDHKMQSLEVLTRDKSMLNVDYLHHVLFF